MKHHRWNSFKSALVLVLLFAFLYVCGSCHLWYQDLKGYLEYWTATVTVQNMEWNASPVSQKNSSGMDTVSSNATITASVEINNPENYELNYEVGTPSDNLKSIRLSGVASHAVLANAKVISSSPTKMTVQIEPLSAVPTPESLALEQQDFTLQFNPTRSESGISASGNDAAVAVAHYVSGSVDKFIERMNREMEILGLEKTRFVEPSGYSELNLTTPREFAAFARVYLARYPESLEAFHSQPSISYPQEHNLAEWHQDKDQAIFQQSTNKLLGVLPGCDGLKTGFIYESGYNLSLTAQRGETRFISVTMMGPGTGSAEGNRYRVADGTNLMEWAFATFATHFKAEIEPLSIPVLGGRKNSVTVAPLHTKPLTVPALLKDESPAAAANSITVQINIPSYIQAPLRAGDVVGKITYSLGDIVLEEVPLLAVTSIEQGNIFKQLVDKLAVDFF